MVNFYIVMDKMIAWGVGKTREQAIQSAAQWVPDQNKEQGISIEKMEKLITSRHEVDNGNGGYYLEPISIKEWDEQMVDIDGSALARLAWEQQWYNCTVPQVTSY